MIDEGKKIALVAGKDVPAKRVALVALGPSSLQYIMAAEGAGDKAVLYDEIWTVNTYASVLKADIVFHMDDIRVQLARAEKNEKIRGLVEYLRTYQGRVITSRLHPDFPCLEAFPLQEAIQELRSTYFNNTVAYAMAYALLRLKSGDEITLFGCDYDYKGSSKIEPGRACLEYWIGRAVERGLVVNIASSSSLMDTNEAVLYGYDTLDVAYRIDEHGKCEVRMTEKENLRLDPDEIERRYDHNPNKEVA